MNTRTAVLVAVLALVPASAFAAKSAAPAHATKSPAGRPMVFPFLHDDYAKALADAKAHKVPLFVDAGAPWCHTCRSMDAFVFTDPALTKDAGRFSWLAVNTENKKNAPFLKKYPIRALPTYLVIDPLTEKVVMRWVGGCSVAQLHQFLDDADVALHGGKPHEPVDVALARADEAYGADKHVEAIVAYREAMAAAPEGWPSYSRAVEALLYSLSQADSNQAVIDLAHAVMPKVAGTPTYISAAGSGLGAAMAMKDEEPNKKLYAAEFEAKLREALGDASIQIASDDRSSYLATLMEARSAAGDSLGEKAAAHDWAEFLERAAREARTPVERAVFDPHRLSAYLSCETPEKAIPMLELSEKEFPDDCNPPARLAIAYLNMKEWDKALAASDRAMAKPMAQGPRRLLYYNNRIDIYTGKGDLAMAKKTLEDEIAYAQALPEGQRSQSRIDGLKKKLDKMNGVTSMR